MISTVVDNAISTGDWISTTSSNKVGGYAWNDYDPIMDIRPTTTTTNQNFLFSIFQSTYTSYTPTTMIRFLQEESSSEGSNTTGTTTSTTEANNALFNDASTLRNTLRVYGSVFLILLFLFCWLRKKYPRVYNIRNWVPDLITSLAKQQYGYFNWMYKLYFLSDTELLDECGMDALCYIRVLELGVKLSAMGILVGIVLMPIYYTAPVGSDTVGITDIVVKLSTTNVPIGNLRLLATVVAAYFIFGYTMYNILWEFEWFYMMRCQFLKKPLPRNYTVYVRCIPEDFQSQTQFQRYFERFATMGGNRSHGGGRRTNQMMMMMKKDHPNSTSSYNSGVLESTIALEIPNLKKRVAERDSVLVKLEHNINIEDVKGIIPIDLASGRPKVDILWEQLEDLNNDIALMIQHIHDMQATEDNEEEMRLLQEATQEQHAAASAAHVTEEETDEHGNKWSNDAETPVGDTGSLSSSLPSKASKRFFSPFGGGGNHHTSTMPTMVEFDESDETEKRENNGREENVGGGSSKPNSNPQTNNISATSLVTFASSVATKTAGAAANTVSKTAGVAANTVSKTANVAAKTVSKTGTVVANTVSKTATVAGEAVTNVADAALSLFHSEDGKPMTAGFVTFTSLQATHAAMQMIQYQQPFTMEVLEAPSPNDIIWSNVGKKHKELQMGKLISFSLTTALCLFWTIPMSFISSLSTIEGLREVPWIDNVLNTLPWLEPVLAQLAPLLVVAANLMLKVILEFLSSFEGPISGAVVQASLFGKLSVFMIIQTFFVSAISGSLVSQFTAMVQDTSLIVDLLAQSLPKQSTYFIQILLVDTCISLGVELLRVSAVAQAGVRSMVGPNLTQEERDTTWMGIRPLADPEEFGHADLMSFTVLYFVVFFVYAVLAPITSIFMFICFLLIGAAYRHQFVYIYPTKPDSGGDLYVQFMKLMPACILIGQVTIVGFLALKRAPAASALMLPLLIITVLFVIYLGQQHFKIAKFLAARQCMDADLKNNTTSRPMDMDFMRHKYMQPEMRDKKKLPSNVSFERQRARGIISVDGKAGNGIGASYQEDDMSTMSSYHPTEEPPRGALENVLGGHRTTTTTAAFSGNAV